MALLLVDDRNGRIVAEVETEEDAQRVLVGTDTSVKVRPLPH
jgi:hypothetical protein